MIGAYHTYDPKLIICYNLLIHFQISFFSIKFIKMKAADEEKKQLVKIRNETNKIRSGEDLKKAMEIQMLVGKNFDTLCMLFVC